MPDHRNRTMSFLVATVLFVAYTVTVSWVYVVKADVDLSGAVLDRHRMDYVVLLVGLYAVGLSAWFVALARIR
jgi:hypothetical protein